MSPDLGGGGVLQGLWAPQGRVPPTAPGQGGHQEAASHGAGYWSPEAWVQVLTQRLFPAWPGDLQALASPATRSPVLLRLPQALCGDQIPEVCRGRMRLGDGAVWRPT